MSLFSHLQAAAQQAQGIHAELGGMPVSGTLRGKNVLLNGARYQGVWGSPVVVEVMRPGGGWSKKTTLMLTLTRDQFSAPPPRGAEVVRTDLLPPVTYHVEKVGTDNPLAYELTCWRTGD